MRQRHAAGGCSLVLALAVMSGAYWSASARAALVATPSTDATGMAQAIVGGGVQVSNAVYTGGTRNDTNALTNAGGLFSGGNSVSLGVDSGVILTTGSVLNAPGPNNTYNVTQENGAPVGNPGDAQLSALVNNLPTYDAAELQFDFTTSTGKLFVRYVFASDEYPEFDGNQFNDVFGFFLDGVNIALIPGTNTPVSVNSINGGFTFPNNGGTVPASHPELYRDNNGPNFLTPSPTLNIQYDGLTTVLTAQATGLSAGTHHLKLAIADTSDDGYDSAVFLSSVTGTDPAPEPASLGLLGMGAAALLLRRRRSC